MGQINRSSTRLRLTAACVKAGRLEDAVRWATSSLKLERSRSQAYQFSRLAGAALSKLGRLEEQEHHLKRARQLAIETKNKTWIADSLASLAEIERSRGNLAAALSMCLEAESFAPDQAREAFHIHANVCRSEGRFDEAIENLTRAGQVGAMIPPGAERHIQAIYKLHMVRNRADLGQFEKAWADLRQAKLELEHDPRLGPWCEATEVRLMALRGSAAEAAVRAHDLLRGSMSPASALRNALTVSRCSVGRSSIRVTSQVRSGVLRDSWPRTEPRSISRLGTSVSANAGGALAISQKQSKNSIERPALESTATTPGWPSSDCGA